MWYKLYVLFIWVNKYFLDKQYMGLCCMLISKYRLTAAGKKKYGRETNEEIHDLVWQNL